MLALYLETLLLMAGAYVLGAALACVVFRAFGARARPVPAGERRVDPLPEMAATARFGAAAAREAAAPAAAAGAAALTQAAAEPADDLKRIKGISAEVEAALNALGLRRYTAIAALTAEEVRRISGRLGKGRINRENWIEQAAVLARGQETHFARRRARGEVASASPTQDEGEEPRPQQWQPDEENAEHARLAGAALPAGVAAAAAARAGLSVAAEAKADLAADARASAPDPLRDPDVAGLAAFAPPAAPPPPLGQAAPLPAPDAAARREADNLLRILGIGEAFAAQLAAHGVHRYSQIAQWSAADVKRVEERLGIAGRIAQENWIEQAQILSRGGDTAFSREFDRKAPPPSQGAPAGAAARAAFSLASLRSMRDEPHANPEPGPQAAQQAAARDKVLGSARGDDLKRIRGIGVLIEKKLVAMGIVTYEQIANWTAEDIYRVSQTLDFKGRIERENWIEQARILASGGVTEFASRVDRGEAGSGRPGS
jgi:predicted flap endonuclease-1-like 5' DNA nuclease